MVKEIVSDKSEAWQSESMMVSQEDAAREYGDSMVCKPFRKFAEVEGDDAARGRGVGAAGVARVGRRQARQGKRFHGDRLKLLVEVCEKWCLFRQPWNTLFVRDAHALIDLGLLEYVKSDNGYIQVRPTETGIDRYKTIVAGVFGVEVEVA